MFQSYKFKPSLILNARKNLLYTTESDGSTAMSLAVTKEYSGGSDRIEVERKGIDEVVVLDLNFVTVLATNQMLSFSELDLAIKRRLYILPFDEIISREEEDKTFGPIFEKVGLEYVFRWMIQGLIMYMENGEHGALIHNQYTDRLVNEALIETGDPILGFMEECLEMHEHHDNFHIDEGVWTGSRPEWCINDKLLVQHFKAWWFDNDYQARDLPSPNSLTRKLRALGMRKPRKMLWVNGRDGRYWLGVKFKPGARIFAMPVMPLNRTN
jgi:phage/plasmid-associated DNA primase